MIDKPPATAQPYLKHLLCGAQVNKSGTEEKLILL